MEGDEGVTWRYKVEERREDGNEAEMLTTYKNLSIEAIRAHMPSQERHRLDIL